MNIYKMIDENCYRENMPSFCAVQNTRIPVLTADLSDNTDILLEINRLRQQVEWLSKHLSTLHRCNCKEPKPTRSAASDSQSSNKLSARSNLNEQQESVQAMADTQVVSRMSLTSITNSEADNSERSISLVIHCSIIRVCPWWMVIVMTKIQISNQPNWILQPL